MVSELDGSIGYEAAKHDDEIVHRAEDRLMHDILLPGLRWERTSFGSHEDRRLGIDGYVVSDFGKTSIGLRCQKIGTNETIWKSFTPRESLPGGQMTEVEKYKKGILKCEFFMQIYMTAPFQTGQLLVAGWTRTISLFSYLINHEEDLKECPRRSHKNGVIYRVCYWNRMQRCGVKIEQVDKIFD